MNDLSARLRVLLATTPDARAEAEERLRATGLAVELLAQIPVGDAPPDVIVVGAQGWHTTLSQLRAGFPLATRVVLADATGPALAAALCDGVHDVIGHDEPPPALARSLRLGAYRAQMEQRFAEISKRYRTAVHGAGLGVMRWDLSDRSMVFDPGWKAMLGYVDDEHRDDSTAWFSRVHPADQAALRKQLRAALDGALPPITLDYRLQHRDGSWLWAGLRLEIERVAADHYVLVGSQEDVTVEKVAAQRVAWADRHDSLTGLLGRTAFVSELDDRMRGSDAAVGVLAICDLVGLKAINYAHGRAAGDEVLLWFGGLLEDRLGEDGLAARLTGDKLGFLLPAATIDAAKELAEDLWAELHAEVFFASDGSEFGVEASVIVAAQPDGAEDAQAWLGAANRGLADMAPGAGAVIALAEQTALTAAQFSDDIVLG